MLKRWTESNLISERKRKDKRYTELAACDVVRSENITILTDFQFTASPFINLAVG